MAAKKGRKCEVCGERKPDVEKMPDPLAAEVYGETWMRNLCEDDAQKIAEDI